MTKFIKINLVENRELIIPIESLKLMENDTHGWLVLTGAGEDGISGFAISEEEYNRVKSMLEIR